MASIRYIFFLLIHMTDYYSVKADPCVVNQPLDKIGTRGTRCPVSGHSSCDRLIDGGWYKVSYRGVPINMPTTCVNSGICGTTFPIWLNGNLPEISAGVVHREACVRGLVAGDCCIRRYNISVKNCGSYNVYKLPYTEACDEVYCFGDHDCDSPVIQSTSSVVQTHSATQLITSAESSSQTDKDQAMSPCPSREYRTDVTAMVAGCLCSAIIGGLVTFLVMYRWDSIYRYMGKVIFDNPKNDAGDYSQYSFKTNDLNVVGQNKVSVFLPTSEKKY